MQYIFSSFIGLTSLLISNRIPFITILNCNYRLSIRKYWKINMSCILFFGRFSYIFIRFVWQQVFANIFVQFIKSNKGCGMKYRLVSSNKRDGIIKFRQKIELGDKIGMKVCYTPFSVYARNFVSEIKKINLINSRNWFALRLLKSAVAIFLENKIIHIEVHSTNLYFRKFDMT